MEPIWLGSVEVPDTGAVDGGADTVAPLDDVTPPLEDRTGPALRIVTPRDGAVVSAAEVWVEGTASDRTGVASVFVRVGPNLPVAAVSDDGFRTFRARVALAPGEQTIALEGWDVDGREAVEPERVRVVRSVEGSDAQPPRIAIDAPADGSVALQPRVELRGRATDDRAVVRMEATLNGEPVDDPIRTDNFFADFTVPLVLVPGESNRIELTAWDDGGRATSLAWTLVGRPVIDREPPVLVLARPAPGDVVEEPVLRVEGSATDDFGIREVRARVLDADGGPLPDSAWVRGVPDDGWSSFTVDLEVPPGPHVVQVRAVDANGLSTTERVPVESRWVAEWGRERTSWLRVRERTERPTLELDLRRDRIGEVLSEAVQRQIVLLELDPTVLLRNTLDAIKTACGTRWREDNPNPRHDCTLTELGRTFAGPDGSWRTSAEYAMVRVLTMTPSNVDVRGTSIAGLQELSDGGFFGITIGGGFGTILAESLGVGRTEELVSTAIAAEGLRDAVLAPHPATTEAGWLPITLYDALNDLTPMGERFGAAGDHPGVIDPAVPPRGVVFTDETGMRLRARSNLRFVDGLSLARGKDFLAIVDDPSGAGDPLEFDFLSEENFDLVGLVPEPLADMRFLVREHPEFVASCSGSDACRDNLPGQPTSANSYWAIDPWTVEAAFARTAWIQYRTRRFRACYIDVLGCQAEVRIGQGGDPAGWTQFRILFGLGNPPRNQYLWELLVEIAQVRLHDAGDRTIPEGEANVAFEVRDIPVGLDADVVRAAIRPYLQEQASLLANLLLGEYDRTNGAVDLYLRADDRGDLWLFFVHPDDPLPRAPTHARPGLFSSPTLDEASRVSRTTAAQWPESPHPKWQVTPGEQVLYAADEDGRVWRLRIEADLDRGEVAIHAAPGRMP